MLSSKIDSEIRSENVSKNAKSPSISGEGRFTLAKRDWALHTAQVHISLRALSLFRGTSSITVLRHTWRFASERSRSH
jgi:hypothetical protein